MAASPLVLINNVDGKVLCSSSSGSSSQWGRICLLRSACMRPFALTLHHTYKPMHLLSTFKKTVIGNWPLVARGRIAQKLLPLQWEAVGFCAKPSFLIYFNNHKNLLRTRPTRNHQHSYHCCKECCLIRTNLITWVMALFCLFVCLLDFAQIPTEQEHSLLLKRNKTSKQIYFIWHQKVVFVFLRPVNRRRSSQEVKINGLLVWRQEFICSFNHLLRKQRRRGEAGGTEEGERDAPHTYCFWRSCVDLMISALQFICTVIKHRNKAIKAARWKTAITKWTKRNKWAGRVWGRGERGGGDKGMKKRWKRMRGRVGEEEEKEDK